MANIIEASTLTRSEGSKEKEYNMEKQQIKGTATPENTSRPADPPTNKANT
jgi:hypothetical protein